ncbi:MAG: hypothetical protein ACRER8_02100 [Pseudomonas sp.]|uniref:hypothetical protein n=1 Tax=Pseudomonas sp. TaxID=306 RepID=UPI003D6FD1B1
MPRVKNRLHIAFIVASGFAAEVFATPAQGLVITTPTQRRLSGTDRLTVTNTDGILAPEGACKIQDKKRGATRAPPEVTISAFHVVHGRLS